MTVSSSTNSVILSANGTDHSFAFTFKIFAASDLKVIVRSAAGVETVKTLNSEYIIADSSVGNANGGNVLFKFNTGTSSDAHYSTTDFRPANGEKVILRREQPQTQGLDLVANDPFPAESFEESLDKLTFMVQDVQEAVDRSLKFSRSNLLDSSGSQISSTYVDIEEDTTARANKLLSFDSTGTPIATQEVGTAKGDWAASTVYQERDIVRDTSTNNLFIVNTAHTSSGSEPLTSNANSSKYTIILNNGAYTNITASGVITGSTIEPTGDTSSGDNAAIGYTSDEGLILTGQGAVSDITFKNDVDVTVFTIPTGTDDILFPDNAKILIGSGSDLRIYHESDNSYIDERGSGRLYILSDTQVEIGNAGNATNARFNSGGSSILHYNNSNKFETSDTGATLTGALTVSSHVVTSEIQLTSGPQPDVRFESTSGGDRFDLGIDATSVFRLRNINDSRDDLKFDGSGVATFGGAVNVTGALTVTGGIADSNLNTITTADKVSGAAIQIDGATDGTSITIVDADKLLIDDNGTTKYINASQLNSYISAAASAVAADNITAGDAAVTITTTSGNITIDAQANNSNIIFKGTDGSVDTTFLTISGADAGQATFNGKIVADAGIDVDDFNIHNDAITKSAGNFSLNADSNILLNTHYDGSTSGGIIALKENNTNFGQLRNNSGELQIKSGASDTTALSFSGADATFSGTINTTSTNKLQFGDSGTYIHQSADGVLDLVSDTEIEINATTIDVNGNLDVSGSATIGSDVTSASGNFVTTGSNIALKHSSGENFFTATKDGASFIYHDAYGILGTVATNAVAIGTTNGNTFTLDTQSTFLEIGNSGIGGGTDAGTLVLSATSNANDERIGDIRFANVANADDDGTDADGKMVARIQTKSVTSDSNAGDDSGGTIVFSTKPEAGSIATALTLGSDQSATFGGDVTFTGANYNVVWDKSDNALEFGDNAKAIFGAGGDLEIYHSGSHSIIKDGGTGNLQINAGNFNVNNVANSANIIVGNDGGAVKLFHNGNNKLETASFGATLSGYAYITENSGTTQLYLRSNYNSTGPAIQGATNHPLMFVTNNSEKMRLDSSGNLGIGTTSPQQLLHVSANNPGGKIRLEMGQSGVANGDVTGEIQFYHNDSSGAGVNADIKGICTSAIGAGALTFGTGTTSTTERMRIDSNGRVGIGESSPDTLLHISDSVSPTIRITNTDPTASVDQTISEIQFEGSDSSTNADGIRAKITALYGGVGGFTSLQFFTAGENTETLSRILDLHSNRATINEDGANIDFRVESSGSENMLFVDAGNDRVGIGTNSPTFNLTVQRNDNETYSTTGFPNGTGHFFKKNNSGTANQYSSIRLQVTNDNGSSNAQACITAIKTSASTHATTLAFQTRQSGGSVAEAFRVDDSQRVIVGKTSNSSSTAGTTLYSNGKIEGVRDGDVVHSFNRLSSNGTILSFQKDGTTVGSINSRASLVTTIILDPRSSGFGITGTGNAFFPTDETGNSTDGTKDVGTSGNRFDDIHATNGTIQTSDKNEKNTIVDSDLGLDFIKRLSPKSYKFNNKTRTHYGLIAQDVETVLSDISKSSTDFAGFIKDDISEDKDGSHYRYGLRYTELIAPIIKALQEANAKIETLEIEVAKLKGE
jgi:hypothetical protein